MIRRRLPLQAGAARCPDTRQQPCSRAGDCARGIEPHAKGRAVEDFSISARQPGAACGWFVAIQYAGQTAAGPKVHDTPRWLP